MRSRGDEWLLADGSSCIEQHLLGHDAHVLGCRRAALGELSLLEESHEKRGSRTTEAATRRPCIRRGRGVVVNLVEVLQDGLATALDCVSHGESRRERLAGERNAGDCSTHVDPLLLAIVGNLAVGDARPETAQILVALVDPVRRGGGHRAMAGVAALDQ